VNPFTSTMWRTRLILLNKRQTGKWQCRILTANLLWRASFARQFSAWMTGRTVSVCSAKKKSLQTASRQYHGPNSVFAARSRRIAWAPREGASECRMVSSKQPESTQQKPELFCSSLRELRAYLCRRNEFNVAP